ncbi:MAG: LysR family transcriptional regulator [Pseudomonadales bacterium]|nr:LysR family transcriptional regulator [Pseudomonadales bacterium]
MDKLRALRYFRRTVELNSFSLASEEFDVPPSSVSRRIKDLEKELGLELLRRTTRHVSTTELGQLYYQRIVKILDTLDDADDLVSQHKGALEGKLRISALQGYGEKVLYPVLQKFSQLYPAITLDLDFSQNLAAFSKDAVDIAIRAGKVSDDRVVARFLFRDEFKMVATSKLIAALQKKYNKDILNVEDLLSCPTIQFRGPYGLVSWWHQSKEKWQKLAINPVMTTNSGDTNLAAVLANEGIAIFPHWWIKEHLSRGEIKEVPFAGCISHMPGPELEMSILNQAAKYQVPKIKLCVDFLLEHLGS